MTTPRALRLALWLLESSRVEDELAGDLLEERARGRSNLWFWTETLAASWSAMLRTAPIYRRSSLTGALFGLTTSWVLMTAVSQTMLQIGWLTHAVDWQARHYVVLLVAGFGCTSVAGWIVARAHRDHPVAALAGFAGFVMTAPIWKLPFLALLYPTMFSASVQPHLTFLILSLVFVAPVSILVGGGLDAGRARIGASR
jgi:hypothetical protein